MPYGLRIVKPGFLLVLLCAGHIGWAHAEIYKYIDADGHVTYSSTPMKGARKLNLEPLVPAPAPERARNNPSPSDFPRVDSETQRTRDSTRRRILEDEMAAEEKLLAEARQSLKEDQSRRSAGKAEKNRALQDEVTLHEKNIDALKSELANVR